MHPNLPVANIIEGHTRPERPFRSPLRYPGGKHKAIDQIRRVLPTHAREYREPMVGGGNVFLHAKSIKFAELYWINDKFKDLASFWLITQDPEACERLIRDLEKLHSSFGSADEIKEYYLKARKEQPTSSYREALLFFFFNRVTFSGTTRAGGFSSSASVQRFTTSSIERLKPLPQALRDVRITSLDFQALIEEPGTDVFLFLDPPYYKATRLYGKNGALHEFDHSRLAALLADTQHRFLITYDDCDEIRNLYSWAIITEWKLQYGMNNCNSGNLSKLGSELFISNYRL